MKTIYLKNLRRELDATDESFAAACCAKLGIPRDALQSVRIVRQALDARKKTDIFHCIHAELTLSDAAAKRVLKNPKLGAETVEPAAEQTPAFGTKPQDGRILVVGLGPAGLFAAWTLAKYGYRPLVVERGRPIPERVKDVQRYWSGAIREPDPDSNVAFGEGGAGTFSDGKLTTRICDPHIDGVLKTLIECGAPEEIGYLAKPHIGTARLREPVQTLRARIEAAGGEVRFSTTLTGLRTEDGRVTRACLVHGETETWEPCAAVILAIGHGARDTARLLYDLGVSMAPKAFAIGVRAEHPQSLINKAQYGRFADHPKLGAADYKLSCHGLHERGAYTFCMCPGGTVVAAASEKEGVIVNGMSSLARDGENANSALLVGIEPKDFPSEHPLAGIYYQREIEHKAYELAGGGYKAPAQLVGDFLQNKKSTALGDVQPTYPIGVTLTNLDECLPQKVSHTMKSAIVEMDKKLHGFNLYDAVLTAPETRSSSSVRIVRDEFLQCNISGVYPCGEGAGYAGGIVSAAVDGIKCAHAVLSDEH